MQYSQTARILRRLAALSLVLGVGLAAQQPQGDRPRVIVLAFDGADHGLARRFIAEGELPNLARLAEQGSFQALGTTNPAESAVSWSSFGRGLNPGQTNMHGFIGRRKGSYFPEARFMKIGDRPLEEVYDPAERARAAVHEPAPQPGWLPLLAGLAGGMLGFFGGYVVARSRVVALVGALVVGGAGGWLAITLFAGGAPSVSTDALPLPERVPTLEKMVEGQTLWHRLDAEGVRVKGFLVPMSTPIDPLAHGRMTGGLGVPDVTGSPTSTYMVLTTAEPGRKTSSNGQVIELVAEGNAFVAELPGPADTVRKELTERRLAELEAGNAPPEEIAAVEAEIAAGFLATVPVRVQRTGANAVALTVGESRATIATGAWSDLLPVHFDVGWPLAGDALARFRVTEVGDDITIFVAPLGYDPRHVPEYMQAEYPAGYGKELAERSGLFDTTGWACVSNPLKDEEIGEDVFLEHIALLTKERSRVVFDQLAQDDWDYYFAMFGETDRVQHLMFRLMDEEHPMYDAALAAKYGSAVRDAYKSMDEIVGQVMDRFVDQRTTLLIVSDHGFNSFRRQVALNSWLLEEGYLVAKGRTSDPAELSKRLAANMQEFLLFMDPKKSRAFAVGLGKIYINLEGREKSGIVKPEDYDALCSEITAKLLALRDPANGKPVVRKVWRNTEAYSGRYAENDADLYLGFEEFYRVSWSTTLGGFSAAVIEDNDSKWSGDHASNHPDIVPGILFSNRPLAPDQTATVFDMAPTILALFGITAPELDGRPLAFTR